MLNCFLFRQSSGSSLFLVLPHHFDVTLEYVVQPLSVTAINVVAPSSCMGGHCINNAVLSQDFDVLANQLILIGGHTRLCHVAQSFHCTASKISISSWLSNSPTPSLST